MGCAPKLMEEVREHPTQSNRRAISSEGRERCNLFIHPYVRGYSRGESEVPCPGGPQVIADSVQQQLGGIRSSSWLSPADHGLEGRKVFLRSAHDLEEHSVAKNSNANRNSTHPSASSLLKEPLARLESGKMGSCSDGIWAETSQDLGLFPLQSVTPQGYGKGYGKTISSNPRVSG